MQISDYRWTLTPRSDLLDLCDKKPEPIALFRDERAAQGHGRAVYGELFEVKEITEEQA